MEPGARAWCEGQNPSHPCRWFISSPEHWSPRRCPMKGSPQDQEGSPCNSVPVFSSSSLPSVPLP